MPRPVKPVTLAEYREREGLTYDQLAQLIGASDRSHTFRLCNGQTKPSWKFAKHIVEVLGGAVSLETLT